MKAVLKQSHRAQKLTAVCLVCWWRPPSLGECPRASGIPRTLQPSGSSRDKSCFRPVCVRASSRLPNSLLLVWHKWLLFRTGNFHRGFWLSFYWFLTHLPCVQRTLTSQQLSLTEHKGRAEWNDTRIPFLILPLKLEVFVQLTLLKFRVHLHMKLVIT